MKKNILKTLATATMLVVGSANAMAQTKTVYTRALTEWSSSDLTAVGTTTTGYWTPSAIATTFKTNNGTVIVDSLGVTTCGRGEGTTQTSTLTFNHTANAMVTITAVWNTGYSSYGNSINYSSFSYGGFEAKYNPRTGGNGYFRAIVNGVTTTLTWPKNYTDLTISLTIDTYTKKITAASITDAAGTSYLALTNLGENTTVADGSVFSQVVVTACGPARNYYTYNGLKSITITEAVIEKSIGTTGFATFSSASNVIVPEGVTVYTAAYDETTGNVLATSLDAATAGTILPSGTGFIIKGTASSTCNFATTSETATVSVSSNSLVANTAEAAISGTTNYGLLKDDKTFALMSENATLGANTAYLTIPSSAKSLQLVFDGETTGVSKIVAAESASDGKVYNLAGQQVSESYKGVVIKNGKKYLNK